MNPKFFLRLMLMCVALAFFAACSSKADRIQSGLDKGAAYVRSADWDKASVEVRNVLQIDPKNAPAYFLAGQIAEGKREMQRAFGSYSKAVELKPDLLEAKVGLARIYLLAGETEKAEQTVQEVLAIDPKHVGARTLKAALLARRNDLVGATAQAKALIGEQKSAPVDASMLLAGLYSSQGNGEAALSVIETALRGDPKNLSLLEVAAQIASASTDEATGRKAVDFFRRATEQAPKNADLWNAWAMYHVRRSELDRAEEVLRASAKAQPDDSQRTLVLLDFLANRRGRDVAEKEFLAAIAEKPMDAKLRFGLVNFYRASNRPADARRALEDIVASGRDSPNAILARDQLAADSLAGGRLEDARTRVAEVLKANPRDGAALVMRGRMRLADGDARAAILDLRAAVRDQPGSPEVVGLLAQAHRQAAEPQLAREVLADAVKFKPDDADLRLLLAADMADAKEYKEAGAEIDRAIQAAPRDLRAYDMKAQLALAQKDTASAEMAYALLKKTYPKDPIGFLRLGKFYADQKRYDAALKEYDAAARLAPDAAEPALYAIGLLIGERRFDDANLRVDALMKGRPKDVLPYQLRGDVAVAKGDLPLAEQSYQKMIEFAPSVPAAYKSLARVKVMRKQTDEAVSVLEQGEKAIPSDSTLAATRAELLARLGRRKEAIDVYEMLLKRSPDEDAYANNLAYLLAENKGDPASLERALALTSRFKDSRNPGYLDSLGWVHYKLGQYSEAATVLERAVKLSPEAPLLQLHLGLALHRKGDDARAQEFLRKAVASKADLPDLDEAKTLVVQR